MSEGMDQPSKKPLVFRYTGDADAFYVIAIAVAMGGAAWVAAWAYLFRARR
jgi:hypothetical protein